MGCCFSRSEGPNSPYPGGAPPSGSARAINTPAQPPSAAEEATNATTATASDNSSEPRRRRHGHHNQPLDQHINRSLRLVPWTSRDRTWTRTLLDREREAFFDTRVTGRPEAWQTIHAALDVLQSPTVDDATLEENIATAQTMLNAADITLPSGNLANGVYDGLGNYYPLPEYVVSDPTNIVDETTEATHDRKHTVSVDEGSDDDGDDEGDEEEEELERRREEKGKAVVDVREQMTVKARLSENVQDIKVTIAKKDTVRALARKVLFESGLPTSKRIRIAYMGKILKENISLIDQGAALYACGTTLNPTPGKTHRHDYEVASTSTGGSGGVRRRRIRKKPFSQSLKSPRTFHLNRNVQPHTYTTSSSATTPRARVPHGLAMGRNPYPYLYGWSSGPEVRALYETRPWGAMMGLA
ncbi:Ubiquitin domain-containing protein 2 [Zalerion maritima]|uniref:Ubiquitin domain-containing protein 2 n=1 Tax=Zalerion maritima TaxID=339359 RepID=A0AAD5WSN3_9PEZI|nr:Ubiquitin domain-containing protein 2 [Zalerion maritima]